MIKDVVGFEENYSVGPNGVIYSKRFDRPICQKDNGKGYKSVNLYKNGKEHTRYVHRVVAEAFLEQWDKEKQVDHIDGDKGNNYSSNLRMVTRSENMRSHLRPRGENRYRGVHWSKKDRVFYAQIRTPEGKTRHIGSYDSDTRAAMDWDREARNLDYGVMALNFPFSIVPEGTVLKRIRKYACGNA